MTDNVRQLRGNPGRRESNYVKAVGAVPNPPTRLKGEALREWKRITPELERLGLLSNLDRAILVLYCSAWQKYVELSEELEDDPKAFYKWRDAANMAVNYAKELGLTPNARLRMKAPEKDSKKAAKELGLV